MILTGEFKDIDNNTLKVVFNNPNITDEDDREFNDDTNNDIYFAGESPITIESDVDDLFTHILTQSAEINLVVKDYKGKFFYAMRPDSVKVVIYKNGVIVFWGYVVPNAYNQDYVHIYDELTLNCIDCLSMSENFTYKTVYNDTTFRVARSNAIDASFGGILHSALDSISNEGYHIYWDKSKSVDGSADNFFANMAISETLVLGDEYDSVWNNKKVMEETLKYINCHIIMKGDDYFIFDWKSLINGNSDFYDIDTDEHISVTTDLTPEYRSDDSQIDVGDAYNWLMLTDEMKSTDDELVNPFDDDFLYSPYSRKQKYLQEKRASGDGADDCKWRDWYFQFMNCENWNCYYATQGAGSVNTRVINTFNINDDILRDSSSNAYNQYRYMTWEFSHNRNKPGSPKMGAMFGKWGNVDSTTTTAGEKQSTVSMSNYLCIYVGGQEEKDATPGYSSKDTTADTRSEWFNLVADELEEKCGGMVTYDSPYPASSLTPSDDETINYLVFNGTFFLQPPLSDDEVNRHVYVATYPKDKPYIDDSQHSYVLLPPLGYDTFKTKYGEYYGDWFVYTNPDGTDKLSYIPLLVCELKIGDRYLVELDGDYEGVYKWMTQEECDKFTYQYTDEEGEVHEETGIEPLFTLGINPNLGDYMLCNEISMKNSLTIEDGVEASGTAIPITSNDKLSGKVTFKILKPYYFYYGSNIRRHPTMLRHTKWWVTTKPLLEYVDTIWVKDFTCKLYSDNGRTEISEDNDLIYCTSETNEPFNRKDDLKFEIITQPTTQECWDKGITKNLFTNSVKYGDGYLKTMATVGQVDGNTKPEEHYLQEYYDLYNEPKVQVTATIHDSDIPFYAHNLALAPLTDSSNFILSISRDYKLNNSKVTIREV